MRANKQQLRSFVTGSATRISRRVLALALPIGALAAGCGVAAKPDRSPDLNAIAAFFEQLPEERARALVVAAPKLAEPIYDPAGKLRPGGDVLQTAAHSVMRTGGLLRANGDGTWRPIEEPSARRSAERLVRSKCNLIEWLAIDDKGERVAAGCPRHLTVWVNGKARHARVPPGQVRAADFTASGELRILLARGVDNNSVLLAYSVEQQRLRPVARFDRAFAQHGCESPQAGSERLTVVAHDLQRSGTVNILQLRGSDASPVMRPVPSDFSARGCIGLADGTILRWTEGTNSELTVPAALERIELEPALAMQEVFRRPPQGRSHSHTGTSIDGAWAAFLEPEPSGAPIGVLHVASTRGDHVEHRPWLAQLGATAGARICILGVPCSSGLLIHNALPLGADAVVVLTPARAAIVSRERWCDVALDEDSWAQGSRQSGVKFTRKGPRIAVPGHNGQVFLFTAEC